MLGNYPNTEPLQERERRIRIWSISTSPRSRSPTTCSSSSCATRNTTSRELAIATYLQAKTYGKPYVLLPAVLVSRGQHHTIAYNAERGALKPSDLSGKRVGVRAYTVTTATWVRGILADDYGVDLDAIEWITFEDPHVAEYRDPETIKRAPAGKELVQMLLDGEIDAAVVGDKLPDPRLKHLIPDHEAARAAMGATAMAAFRSITWSWSATELSKSRPDVVARGFPPAARKQERGGCAEDPEPLRFGVEACRPVLETMIGYCYRQGLIPAPLSVDSLFDDVTRKLGA